MRLSPFLLLFLAAPALLPACGGDVSNGGSTSGGGSSGTGNGGSGGSSSQVSSSSSVSTGHPTNECPPELQFGSSQISVPLLGFADPQSASGTAVVQAVDPAGLDLSVDPGAPLVRFYWSGPDLSGAFTVGEVVNIGTSPDWHYITGQTSTAATLTQEDFASLPIPAIPGSGPTMDLAVQCRFYDPDCSAFDSVVELYALDVEFNAEMVSIPFGGAAAVGPWQINHLGAVAFPGCMGEGYYVAAITSLGPIPPP